MPSRWRFLFPKTYVRKIREWWHRIRYDLEAMRRVEAAKFAALMFDRNLAAVELDRHLLAMGLPPFEQCGDMASVHWLLFACLQQTGSIHRILEIGTYDGKTTALLSRLFPKSQIVTLDLPATDPLMAGSYDYARGDARKRRLFEQKLETNTSASNVTLLRMNSFFLPESVQGRFDLILVDGGHLYPENYWDICNAYHLCQKGGYLMCDDVIPLSNGLRDDYVSPDSYQVLRYVTERSQDTMHLFLKREAAFWSADPRERKFVALLRKKINPGTSV